VVLGRDGVVLPRTGCLVNVYTLRPHAALRWHLPDSRQVREPDQKDSQRGHRAQGGQGRHGGVGDGRVVIGKHLGQGGRPRGQHGVGVCAEHELRRRQLGNQQVLGQGDRLHIQLGHQVSGVRTHTHSNTAAHRSWQRHQ